MDCGVNSGSETKCSVLLLELLTGEDTRGLIVTVHDSMFLRSNS